MAATGGHDRNVMRATRLFADVFHHFQTETAEGIRALVIDKDKHPRWHPARIEDVTPDMVLPIFDSPWAAHSHPLRDLS